MTTSNIQYALHIVNTRDKRVHTLRLIQDEMPTGVQLWNECVLLRIRPKPGWYALVWKVIDDPSSNTPPIKVLLVEPAHGNNTTGTLDIKCYACGRKPAKSLFPKDKDPHLREEVFCGLSCAARIGLHRVMKGTGLHATHWCPTHNNWVTGCSQKGCLYCTPEEREAT